MARPTPYTSKISVPMPDETRIRAVIGESFDAAATLNVVQMFAGTEEFYPALIGMVQAVFGTPDVSDRHREVIILRAAATLNAPYEWQANEQMARNAGLTPEQIDAIAADGAVTGIDPEFVLLTEATDEMLGSGSLTDPTLQHLLETFGDTVTRKYIVTISWFSFLSLFLNACRVPLETSDKIGRRTNPLG